MLGTYQSQSLGQCVRRSAFGVKLKVLLPPPMLSRLYTEPYTNCCWYRTQGRAASPTRPCSGRPSQYSRACTEALFAEQPRQPVTGVAGKGLAAPHRIPHQGCRGSWKQGCFQPPWASMRRRPGVSTAPPSDWGWVALNPGQV